MLSAEIRKKGHAETLVEYRPRRQYLLPAALSMQIESIQ
jgi:hypothetical protein